MKLVVNGEKILDVSLNEITGQTISFEFNGKKYQFDYVKEDNNTFKISQGNSSAKVYAAEKNGEVEYFQSGKRAVIKEKSMGSSQTSEDDTQQLEYHSPMPGKISKILFSPGQVVKKGDVLMYLEAMKMEHPIKAKMNGGIDTINVVVGGQVNQNQLLIKLKKI